MSGDPKAFRRFRVIPIEDGQPLGLLLSRRLPGVDRKLAAKIIKAGGVYVNKLRIRLPMVRVAAGERITVYPYAHEAAALDSASLKFVHRDESFVVLDKPSGVPVAQTRESSRGTLAAALREHLENEGARRPYVGVVHRLDRGASGLVLFTIRDIANKSLHKQFLEHSIVREYLLEVQGRSEGAFTIDTPLRLGKRTVRIADPGDTNAASARSHFETLATYSAEQDAEHASQSTHRGDRSLLRARLETGRTHQIRAHISHRGLPIVGDRRYGPPVAKEPADQASDAPRASQPHAPSPLRLHASRLRFAHPTNGAQLEFYCEHPSWAALHLPAADHEGP